MNTTEVDAVTAIDAYADFAVQYMYEDRRLGGSHRWPNAWMLQASAQLGRDIAGWTERDIPPTLQSIEP